MNNDVGYVAKSAVRLLGFGAAPRASGQTLGQRIVQTAETYLGVPFAAGGASRAGVDDGGLVRAVFADAGIDLPQQASAQAAVGTDVPRGQRSAWAPGDRLYFAWGGAGVDHAGLYLGKGLFLHTSVAHGRQVAIDRIADAAYAGHLVAVRRSRELLNEPAPPGAAPPPAPATPPALAANASSPEADLLAGLTPVRGPGLIVTLRDSKKPLPGNVHVPGAPTLIHDTDINQVVNELKAAGAEAIAVNDQRLVGMSPIRSVGAVIDINTVPQAPPFVIKAIGDARAMQAALNLPNGVADQLRHMDPAMIAIQPSPGLTLPAYTGTAQPRYAHPVGPSDKAALQRQLVQALDAYMSAQARLNALTVQLHATSPQVKTTLDPRSRPEVQRAAAKLNVEQASLQALATRYAPSHPLLGEARARYHADKDAYRRLLREPYIVTHKNPRYAALQAQLAAQRQLLIATEAMRVQLSTELCLQLQANGQR